MSDRIGETFVDELAAAGIVQAPLAWFADGRIIGLENLTPAQQAIVQAVFAAHDPTKLKARSFQPVAILRFLKSVAPVKLRLFLSQMDEIDKADFLCGGLVRLDDPRVVAMLTAIGATAAQLDASAPRSIRPQPPPALPSLVQ